MPCNRLGQIWGKLLNQKCKLLIFSNLHFKSLSLEESNLHSQNQNLVHYHYAKGQSIPC